MIRMEVPGVYLFSSPKPWELRSSSASATYSEDSDLLRLAEFQGRNKVQRLDVVIDLRRDHPTLALGERKRFGRNRWALWEKSVQKVH